MYLYLYKFLVLKWKTKNTTYSQQFQNQNRRKKSIPLIKTCISNLLHKCYSPQNMIGCSFLKNIVKQVPSQDIMREQITNACTHKEGITNIIHYLRFFILLSLYTMKFVELYIWMYIVIDFKLLWQLNRPINNVKRVHTGLHSEYVILTPY
jgi:hypothetical protein